MVKAHSIGYLRDEVARIITPSISMRRRSQQTMQDEAEIQETDFNAPPSDWEVDEFLVQCPFNKDELSRAFVEAVEDHTYEVELTEEELREFQDDVETWASNNTWLGADDWPLVTSSGEVIFSHDFVLDHQTRYDKEELQDPQLQIEIGRLSPSFTIFEKLLNQGIRLETLHWREFEELVADLLRQDGYVVELGPGQKDGGKDIVAVKEIGKSGLFKAVWQAKKLNPGNKVGISVIRELADVRQEQKASKGIVVTTTFLTSTALQRVRRDEYILGKVDRDDLMKWIDTVLKSRRKG